MPHATVVPSATPQPSVTSAAPPSLWNYSIETIHNSTCVIHTSYDPSSPPLLPGPSTEWTRFVCISDTHTQTFPVPDGDVLIHSGDLTGKGRKEQMQVTGDW